jgi:hypothetical protein
MHYSDYVAYTPEDEMVVSKHVACTSVCCEVLAAVLECDAASRDNEIPTSRTYCLHLQGPVKSWKDCIM